MAIDTTSKRMSATFLILPFYTGVFTDGTVDIEETVAASWMYNGITPASPSVVTAISETGIGFTLYIDQAINFTNYIDQARNFNMEL